MQRCDSCGVPLKEDNLGTEGDGSASENFCSTCYAKGTFTLPDGPVEKVRERSVAALVKLGVPPHTANKLTEKIEGLPRWK